MDLNYSPQDAAFRDEVRDFVRNNLPADISRKVLEHKRLEKNDFVRWQQALHKKGWMAPGWPKQFGGPGWSPVQRHIFDEECADAGAPYIVPFGPNMVAPVIMAFGNDAQKNYYLPRIQSSQDWWCQGYSEPGSGSDLASLKTKAVREADHYIVNGQKTWTTLGQHADWIFCLVRTATDPEVKKQEGISFLLIDMKTPGITVRPIILLDGEHEVNEVWFDNVKVPVQNLVGEEGKGWTYAKFLLSHERTGIAGVGRSKRELAYLKKLASAEMMNGEPLIKNPRFRDKIANLEMELMALEITNLRVVSADAERKAPGPEASILKVKGTEIQQLLGELMMEAIGPYAAPYNPDDFEMDYKGVPIGPANTAPLAAHYFNLRKTSIYGGSNEIQKNIISQMILGL